MRRASQDPPAARVWNGNAISASRDGGLLPWLDWRFSLIFPLAIVMIAATMIVQILDRTEYLEVQVTDQISGAAVAGAQVTIGDTLYSADDEGIVRIERPSDTVTIRVGKEGYLSVSGQFGESNSNDQQVQLVPVTSAVSPVDEVTHGPPTGAHV